MIAHMLSERISIDDDDDDDGGDDTLASSLLCTLFLPTRARPPNVRYLKCSDTIVALAQTHFASSAIFIVR